MPATAEARLAERLASQDTEFASLKASTAALQTEMEGKIDLRDARQVLSLRREVEEIMRSDLLRSLSKAIAPALDVLKQGLEHSGLPQPIADAIRRLDARCKQEGIITEMNKLF